jgi:hypothetical protein
MGKFIEFFIKVIAFFKGKKKWIILAAFVLLFLAQVIFSAHLPTNWWIPAVTAFVAAIRAALAEIQTSNKKNWITYASFGAVVLFYILEITGFVPPFGISYDQIYLALAGGQMTGIGVAVKKLRGANL